MSTSNKTVLNSMISCLGFVFYLVSFLLSLVYCEDSCPPPVGQFLTLNGYPYNSSREITVKAKKTKNALVARLKVEDNQYYNSPKCSVLEDARNDLYNNFGIREEYDPQTFTRGKDCVVYLARTSFPENTVAMTILLIAEVTPGLSTSCSVLVSSRAAFTVEFCEKTDRSEACTGPAGRNVDFGPARTENPGVDGGVIIQREIVVNVGEKPEVTQGNAEGKTGNGSALSSDIQDSQNAPLLSSNIAPIILAILIGLLILLLAALGCFWCRGCVGAKGSRPNSVNSYNSDEIRNVVRNEDFRKNDAHNNFDNHQIKFHDSLEQRGYETITRDGNRLAVINAEDIEDGLIIVPGRKRNFTVLEEIDPSEVPTIPRHNQQIHPYPQYLRNGQGPNEYRESNTGYSLNVLNLEGESLGSSYNSRFSRHSYEQQWNNGNSKLTQRGIQTSAEKTNKNIQADLDHTRTVLPEREEEKEMSLNSSMSSGSISLPSTMAEELEKELLPIKETKASMARKRKISQMHSGKGHVHCHYPKKPSQ